MKLKSIQIVFLSLLLFSCDKTKNKNWTEVIVNVKNPITDEPIEDVYCAIYNQKGGVLNTKVEKQGAGSSENGEYNFGFKAKKNKTYWAETTFDIDKYYPVKFSNYLDLTNGITNRFEMELVPEAYLSTKYTNTSCFNENDEIIIYRPNIDVPSYNGYPENPDPYYGCFDNTTSYVGLPSGRYAFEWQVTKNSSTSVFYDTLNLLPGDSILYEINY